MTNIYDAKLHEIIRTDDWHITRVPGGWIYTHHRLDSNTMTSVFVPYDNGFYGEAANDQPN